MYLFVIVVKVEFVESLSIGVENNYLNLSVCEDASACVGSSFSNGISESIPGSFSLCFFAAISSASACCCSGCSLHFLSFSPSLCPHCEACLRFVLSFNQDRKSVV